MKKLTDSRDYSDLDNNLINIIQINNAEQEDADDIQDYDFDYDPNEMYFALLDQE